jgi:hypothetical protein
MPVTVRSGAPRGAPAATAIALASFVSLAAISSAAAYEGPSFRKGLWRFERATEMLGKRTVMPAAARVRVEPTATRCVDPTESMRETFRPLSMGACRSTPARKKGNVYVFTRRCDQIGPVRTTLVIDGDAAYREMHELAVGPSPRREVIVARRIGDCEGYELAADVPLQMIPTIGAGALLTLAADND